MSASLVNWWTMTPDDPTDFHTTCRATVSYNAGDLLLVTVFGSQGPTGSLSGVPVSGGTGLTWAVSSNGKYAGQSGWSNDAMVLWWAIATTSGTAQTIIADGSSNSLYVESGGCALYQFRPGAGQSFALDSPPGAIATHAYGESASLTLPSTSAEGLVFLRVVGNEDDANTTFTTSIGTYIGNTNAQQTWTGSTRDTAGGAGYLFTTGAQSSLACTFTASPDTNIGMAMDSFVLTGGGSGVTGELDVTLADATASASGTVKTHGTLSATLAAAVLAAAGAVAVAGSGGGVLGNATLAAMGTVQTHGALSQTLGAATASGIGAVRITGGLSQTLAPATLAASGTVVSGRVGQLNVTLGDATLAGSGNVRVTGTASNTLAPATVAATGAVRVAGTASNPLAPATATGVGAVRVSGSLAATLAPATLTASGTSTPGNHGGLNATLAPAALSAHGTVATHGTLAQALAGASLTGSGALAVRGSAALTLDPATGTASGVVPITGSLSAMLAPATLVATGRQLGAFYPPDPLYYVQMPPRAFYAAMPRRPFYILSNPNMTPTFSNLDPRETEVLTFDASSDLGSGETLTAIEKVDITVQSGPPTSTLPTLTDPIINGAPVTLTVNGKTITIATGCCVQVVASGGVSNCQYLIAITCNTSNSDKVLTLKGILPINAQ